MTTHRARTTVPGILLAVMIAGCGSTPEVHQLADKTAANVGTISAHLRRLGDNSRRIAERRAANIASLHAANAELRAQYEYDVALTRRTGGAANLRLLDDIEAWRKEVDGIFEKARGAEEARRASALATQTTLDTRAKALAEIAQALAGLAEEEKAADRVRFLRGYARSLKEELDTALERDDRTAKAAHALLDEVEGKIKAQVDAAR